VAAGAEHGRWFSGLRDVAAVDERLVCLPHCFVCLVVASLCGAWSSVLEAFAFGA
jgi:hypothetical protein